MARNIEIKARIASIAALQPRVAALAQHAPELIEQDDTFFHCAQGRLKLRQFADGRGELIAYDRPDTLGPKTSNYLITPTHTPDALRNALARALCEAGRVKKLRLLFLVIAAVIVGGLLAYRRARAHRAGHALVSAAGQPEWRPVPDRAGHSGRAHLKR